jgi:peptidoglycan/LPS O-acetylase OafA/YrhL
MFGKKAAKMGKPSGSGAIPSLDGLRAISILIVLVSHSGYGNVVPGGFGVTVFFFLSGYLITTLLLDEQRRNGRISIWKFYLRRAFRLFPPLLVTLAIAYSLVAVGLLGGGISCAGITAQLLYFANYYGLFFDPGNTTAVGTGILWSLAVEEHFYMLYPAALTGLIALGLSKHRIAIVFALVCVVVLIWRVYLVMQPHFVAQRTYYSSDTRVDSIIFGCILSIVASPKMEKSQMPNPILTPVPLVLLAIAIFTLVMTIAWRDAFFRETLRYTIQGLALMPIFYFSIKYAAYFPFKFLNHPWLAKIGVYSYAIYLIHHIVINAFHENFPWLADQKPLLVLTTFGIATLYALLLDLYMDSFFRRLRTKFR